MYFRNILANTSCSYLYNRRIIIASCPIEKGLIFVSIVSSATTEITIKLMLNYYLTRPKKLLARVDLCLAIGRPIGSIIYLPKEIEDHKSAQLINRTTLAGTVLMYCNYRKVRPQLISVCLLHPQECWVPF